MRSLKLVAGTVLALSIYCNPANVRTSHANGYTPFELYESTYVHYDNIICNCYDYSYGIYTLVNKSHDWLVTGFEVTNPYAGTTDSFGVRTVPGTYQPYWEATALVPSSFNNNVNSFKFQATDLEGYLGYGIYSAFFWGPEVVMTSGVVVSYLDENNIPQFTDQFEAVVTPLPAALPLMGSVLGSVGLLAWLRRRKAVASRAA